MAYPRHNPLALVDPKLSVVIPVYNEKVTLDEILRRVIETDFRKEILIVDDCSTDGSRQILEKFVQLQNSGESAAPAQDGADFIPLRDLRIFFQDHNHANDPPLLPAFAQVTAALILSHHATPDY